MAQREVIHLTLGSISQHISTHFFNQQSSHFQYGDAASADSGGKDDLLLDPNVDFQEGTSSRRSEQTFFPREVVVGFKGNLGAGWDAYNVLFEDEEGAENDNGTGANLGDEQYLRQRDVAAEGLRAWSRPAELLLTEKHCRSRYELGESDDEEELFLSEAEEELETTSRTSIQSSGPDEEQSASSKPPILKDKNGLKRRPREAYAHNKHHPRSLRPLPRLYRSGLLTPMGSNEAEGSNPFSTFEMGLMLAREMEQDASFMEDNIRWFAEESDLLQCFNLTTSTSDGFAGYSHELLQGLSDEYPKTPVIAWGAHDGLEESGESRQGRLRKMNKILALWSLSSAQLYTPLQVPLHLLDMRRRDSEAPQHYFSSRADWTDEYQAGALFSAHIDTAMLQLRLRDKSKQDSAASLLNSLNWRRDTPIGSLGGCMPTPLLAPMETKATTQIDPIDALLASRGYASRGRGRDEQRFETPQERARKAAERIRRHFVSFSPTTTTASSSLAFAENVIARDDDKLAEKPTFEALEAWNQLQEPAGLSTFVPVPFNVRSASFPQLFSRLTSNGKPLPFGNKARPKVKRLPMMASLSTSAGSVPMLRDAYRYLDKTVIGGHDPLYTFGLGGSRGSSAGQAASEESEGFLGGRDGLMEVREHLQELLGAYEGDGNDEFDVNDEEGLGTDEEYEGDNSEWKIDDD